jgi:ribosomal protein S15P/S13E
VDILDSFLNVPITAYGKEVMHIGNGVLFCKINYVQTRLHRFLLRRPQQFFPLAPALVGQQRIVASHQPLAGKLGRTDLGQVGLVEQRTLQIAAGHQHANRTATKGRNPTQFRMLLERIDLCLREHAAVAHQDHSRKPEPLAKLRHLVRHRRGITRVAGIDFHGHRPALEVGQHAVDDDRPIPLAVPVVTVAGQRTRAAFVVTAADVVQHQRPFQQVLAGELLLDRRLTLQQPIQGVVEFVLVGIGYVQLLGQGGRVPVPGGRQLRAGKQQPLDDHRHDQIPLA